jgi:hypothetical protein
MGSGSYQFWGVVVVDEYLGFQMLHKLLGEAMKQFVLGDINLVSVKQH